MRVGHNYMYILNYILKSSTVLKHGIDQSYHIGYSIAWKQHSSRNIPKRSRIWYSILLQNLYFIFVRIFKNSQNIPEYSKMFHKILTNSQIFQYNIKEFIFCFILEDKNFIFFKIFLDIHRYFRIFKYILRYSKIF